MSFFWRTFFFVHTKGLALMDGEPNLDLIEPGGMGWRVVEFDVGMRSQPSLVLLMGVAIIERRMPLPARIGFHETVHESEEFQATPALGVGSGDLSGRDV